jgi:hypothetical protein
MKGFHSQQTKDKLSAIMKTKWQDPVWREQQMLRRQEQKENGTYKKRGEAISKTRRKKNKGNSCIVCGGYRLLLGYGNGGILEHRKVMEDYLGRPLETDEIVHHCDGTKLNNNIENLELVLKSKHLPTYHPNIYKGRPSNNKGKHHTEESKEKMRQAALARPGNRGKQHTETTKQKMRDAQLKRHAERKRLGLGYKHSSQENLSEDYEMWLWNLVTDTNWINYLWIIGIITVLYLSLK